MWTPKARGCKLPIPPKGCELLGKRFKCSGDRGCKPPSHKSREGSSNQRSLNSCKLRSRQQCRSRQRRRCRNGRCSNRRVPMRCASALLKGLQAPLSRAGSGGVCRGVVWKGSGHQGVLQSTAQLRDHCRGRVHLLGDCVQLCSKVKTKASNEQDGA